MSFKVGSGNETVYKFCSSPNLGFTVSQFKPLNQALDFLRFPSAQFPFFLSASRGMNGLTHTSNTQVNYMLRLGYYHASYILHCILRDESICDKTCRDAMIAP
jgi:hypothetical protein